MAMTKLLSNCGLNLHKDITFPISSMDSKLGFLSVGIKLLVHIFPNSKWDFGIFKYSSSWMSQFFSFHEKDGNLSFLKLRFWSSLDFIFFYIERLFRFSVFFMKWEKLRNPAGAIFKNPKISFWVGENMDQQPKTNTRKSNFESMDELGKVMS